MTQWALGLASNFDAAQALCCCKSPPSALWHAHEASIPQHVLGVGGLNKLAAEAFVDGHGVRPSTARLIHALKVPLICA